MRTLSNTFKAAVFAAETGEAFIILLTLDHDDLANPIRVTPDPYEDLPNAGVKGVVSNGLEYIALPFEIILPGEDEDSLPVSRIRMDNISREIGLAIRSMQPTSAPPAATISIVLSSDTDVEEISIPGFQLNNIRMDVFTVEGELGLERTDLAAFPPLSFTPSNFPGLF